MAETCAYLFIASTTRCHPGLVHQTLNVCYLLFYGHATWSLEAQGRSIRGRKEHISIGTKHEVNRFGQLVGQCMPDYRRIGSKLWAEPWSEPRLFPWFDRASFHSAVTSIP